MHPERAERITAIEAELEGRGRLGYELREAPPATEEQLRRVHPISYLESVREHCERGVGFDLDTPVVPASWEAALHSAGGACALAEELLSGRAPTGFCVLRPPGHHAEAATAMGFCLFANAAVAARHALEAMGAERVMVIDWDVHHGNGTNAIFRFTPEVLFASIHQWPFWPGSGEASDIGTGAGEGYSLNLPVPARSGEAEWLDLMEHVVVPVGLAYAPDLVLVSAGYDAHRDDLLGECLLDSASFARLAGHVRWMGAELGVPVGAVLEGGYELRSLAESVAATMEVLAGGGDRPQSVERGPLSAAAAARHAAHWPVLGAYT